MLMILANSSPRNHNLISKYYDFIIEKVYLGIGENLRIFDNLKQFPTHFLLRNATWCVSVLQNATWCVPIGFTECDLVRICFTH